MGAFNRVGPDAARSLVVPAAEFDAVWAQADRRQLEHAAAGHPGVLYFLAGVSLACRWVAGLVVAGTVPYAPVTVVYDRADPRTIAREIAAARALLPRAAELPDGQGEYAVAVAVTLGWACVEGGQPPLPAHAPRDGRVSDRLALAGGWRFPAVPAERFLTVWRWAQERWDEMDNTSALNGIRYAGGVLAACRWLAGAAVHSPIGREVRGSGFEEISAEHLLAAGAACRGRRDVHVDYARGVLATLDWVWCRSGRPPVELPAGAAG